MFRPLAVLAASLALVTLPVSAEAAVNTPVAGVSATPSQVAVGTPSTIKVTATNTGSKRIAQVALGVVSPLGWSNVKMPVNGSCRAATGGLLYCLVTGLGVGKTATLSFTVTPAAAGTFTFNSYARNIATMTETGASTTLTAS